MAHAAAIGWQTELCRQGVREIAMISLARQGAISAGQVLCALAVDQGKHVYQGLNVRGGRSNNPVINSIRIAERAHVPASAASYPTELLVLDESLYGALPQEPKALRALLGFTSGCLVVNTPLAPGQVRFPFDFAGTVATVDARRIAVDVLGVNPPPFGTTLLGLHAAATGAWAIDTLTAAIRRRFPGKVGEKSARAACLAYEQARVQEEVTIRGFRGRADRRATLADVPEFVSLDAAPLPGVSGGNVYIWREQLPVWHREKCRCVVHCPLVHYCPEGVISQQAAPWRYHIDYEYCKGCGICAQECLAQAITMDDAATVYGR